jgi:hypothetical protein
MDGLSKPTIANWYEEPNERTLNLSKFWMHMLPGLSSSFVVGKVLVQVGSLEGGPPEAVWAQGCSWTSGEPTSTGTSSIACKWLSFYPSHSEAGLMGGRGTWLVIDLCLENGTRFKYFHWNSGGPGSVLLGLPVPLFQNVGLFTHGEKQNTTQIRRKYTYSLMWMDNGNSGYTLE